MSSTQVLARCGDADPERAAPNILDTTPENQAPTFRNQNQVWPVRVIRRGDAVRSLPPHARSLADLTFEVGGVRLGLSDHMARRRTAGLLMLKHGEIALERYGMGNGPESRWTSMSTAKSMTATLVGAALHDGARYYAPWLALWSPPDPAIDKAPSKSSYQYAAANPVRFIDGSGHEPQTPDLTGDNAELYREVDEWIAFRKEFPNAAAIEERVDAMRAAAKEVYVRAISNPAASALLDRQGHRTSFGRQSRKPTPCASIGRMAARISWHGWRQVTCPRVNESAFARRSRSTMPAAQPTTTTPGRFTVPRAYPLLTHFFGRSV
jgi:RHS repeat-associated protein